MKLTDDMAMAITKKNKGTETLPFSKILHSIMAERVLTVRQEAELAGVKHSVIQNWLEGKNPHDLKSVARLATALGVSFKALLLGEQEDAAGSNLSSIYEEQDLFDGLAKITIKRLVPRK